MSAPMSRTVRLCSCSFRASAARRVAASPFACAATSTSVVTVAISSRTAGSTTVDGDADVLDRLAGDERDGFPVLGGGLVEPPHLRAIPSAGRTGPSTSLPPPAARSRCTRSSPPPLPKLRLQLLEDCLSQPVRNRVVGSWCSPLPPAPHDAASVRRIHTANAVGEPRSGFDHHSSVYYVHDQGHPGLDPGHSTHLWHIVRMSAARRLYPTEEQSLRHAGGRPAVRWPQARRLRANLSILNRVGDLGDVSMTRGIPRAHQNRGGSRYAHRTPVQRGSPTNNPTSCNSESATTVPGSLDVLGMRHSRSSSQSETNSSRTAQERKRGAS